MAWLQRNRHLTLSQGMAAAKWPGSFGEEMLSPPPCHPIRGGGAKQENDEKGALPKDPKAKPKLFRLLAVGGLLHTVPEGVQRRLKFLTGTSVKNSHTTYLNRT